MIEMMVSIWHVSPWSLVCLWVGAGAAVMLGLCWRSGDDYWRQPLSNYTFGDWILLLMVISIWPLILLALLVAAMFCQRPTPQPASGFRMPTFDVPGPRSEPDKGKGGGY